MRKFAMSAFALVLFVGLTYAPAALAQDDDGPGTRVMTTTTFHVPYGPDRGVLMDWMEENFHPFALLNPNVVSYRVMFHNWGSQGDQIVIAAEYNDFADIQADCGQPCDDWAEAHPAPEEGDEGYEDFQKAVETFNKYYSKHRDEIYLVPLEEAKTNGQVHGTVGHEPDEDDM